jgi:hypothetical protein
MRPPSRDSVRSAGSAYAMPQCSGDWPPEQRHVHVQQVASATDERSGQRLVVGERWSQHTEG